MKKLIHRIVERTVKSMQIQYIIKKINRKNQNKKSKVKDSIQKLKKVITVSKLKMIMVQ